MVKKITVIGVGGTIAMTATSGGLQPARSAADLLAGIGGIVAGVDLRIVEPFNKPSANIGFGDIEQITGIISDEVEAGCNGIVLIQGTDSIEETAFALELLNTTPLPIVVTGAMRGASSLSADGPANLAGAIIVARDMTPDVGPVVFLNDQVHAARWVRKAHTTALDAFASPDESPIGRLHEGALIMSGRRMTPLAVLAASTDRSWPRTALIRITMGDDGALLKALPDLGFDACVVEAMGAGHVPADLAPIIDQFARMMPVALASRTGTGRVCTQTYGYPGSETDLIRRGVMPAGRLSGLKARVALTVCLKRCGAGAREAFAHIAASV